MKLVSDESAWDDYARGHGTITSPTKSYVGAGRLHRRDPRCPSAVRIRLTDSSSSAPESPSSRRRPMYLWIVPPITLVPKMTGAIT
jgi:hypothetical protein